MTAPTDLLGDDVRIYVHDATGKFHAQYRARAYQIYDSGMIALRDACAQYGNPHERIPKLLLWPIPGGCVEVLER